MAELRNDHVAIQELLGAYALDALERDEAEVVERHLEVCPRCRAEVREHREVAGLLGYAGQDAPAGLWDRIAASTQEPPPVLRLQRVPGTASPQPAPSSAAPDGGAVADFAAAAGGSGPSAAGIGGAAGGRTEVVDLAAARRARRVPLWARVAGAAAAVAAVAVLAVQVARLDHRTSTLAADVRGTAPTMQVVQQALGAPGARRVVLARVGGGDMLDAVVLPGGQGYLYHSDLAPMPTSETYQLWGITGGQPVSYGLLGPAPGQVVAFRAGPGVQALAVTAEVAGGVTRSAHPPVAAGAVVPAL